MEALSEQKARLRAGFAERRDGLDPAARALASAQMCRHLLASERWNDASGIAAFVSIRSEPDTAAVLTAALARGRSLWLPRLESRTELSFRRVEGDEALEGLVPGRFGLLEPPDTAPSVNLSRASGVDLVIVPGLAFGRDGSRLGYGAGYYDRALAVATPADRPTACGICFDRFFDPPEGRPPMAEHDVPMDYVLTESGLHALT